MKKVSKILAVVALVATTGMYAQGTKKVGKVNPELIVKMLDKNKDGKISLAEAKKAPKKKLAENFAVLDFNGDGFIEVAEFKKAFSMRKAGGKKGTTLLDTNKDGKVSVAEASEMVGKRATKHIKKFDTNNNGFLEPNELQEMKKQREKYAKS